MKQVEIFFASTTKDMQENVNVWLKKNKEITVLEILQNTTGLLGTTNGGSIVITILYEE